jgi:chemotaxis protein MotB
MFRKQRSESEQNFWISYADLMAGLLFVFILLVGAIVVKTVLIRSDLQAIRADLQKEKAALGLSEQALAEKKRQLRDLQKRMAAAHEENVHLSMEIARLQSEAARLKLSLDRTAEALSRRQAELEEKNSVLSLTKKEMAELKALLMQTQDELRGAQTYANTLEGELRKTKTAMQGLQRQVQTLSQKHEDDTNLIKLRDDEVAQLQKALLLKTRDYQQAVEDLNLTRVKIKNLTGIKVKVVKRLKETMGDSIRIDPKTGALRLSSNILFTQGQATLKPEAKQELSRILGRYIDTLLSDPQMRRYIDLITIEGHTNSDGTYLYNLQLSQKRALAVMEFLYTQYPKNRALFRRYLSASGRSYAEPVLGADGKEDKEASRRIEIKFRIKNEEAVRELMNYLNKADTHDR